MFKIKKLKPLYTGIITTANRYTQDSTSGLIIDSKKLAGNIKEYQTVLEIGSSVREVKVGDTVLLDFSHYLVKDKSRPENDENSIRSEFLQPTYHLELPVIEMDNNEVLTLQEKDVAFIADIEEGSSSPIITPKKANIIM